MVSAPRAEMGRKMASFNALVSSNYAHNATDEIPTRFVASGIITRRAREWQRSVIA